MEHLKRFEELSPESQGQNLALTVSYAPHSLDSGGVEVRQLQRVDFRALVGRERGRGGESVYVCVCV